MQENIRQDTCTIETARRIRAHQGFHEAEVSCGGEADLHKHCKGCQKNPGHSQFTPVKDFKIEHLPPGFRNNDVFDWIKAEADLTCRLSVKYTSESRPQFFPDSNDPYPFYQDRGGDWMRTGTGWVASMLKFTEKMGINCRCETCSKPDTHPLKVWGKVEIYTACHVVFNSEEARHTTCHFFYDTSDVSIYDVNKCPTFTGFNVEHSDIKGDMCMLTCVTHDMDLFEKLAKLWDGRLEVFERVRRKYWLDQRKGIYDSSVSCVTNPSPGPVVIISHPHGLSKQITIGEWTQRQKWRNRKIYKLERYHSEAEGITSTYWYNAATCPGSSGAPVIRLLEKGRVGWWWLLYSHPHSGGDEGNNNYSGMREEFVTFPPTPGDKWSKLGMILIGLCLILGFVLSVTTAAIVSVRFGTFLMYMWFLAWSPVITWLVVFPLNRCLARCRHEEKECPCFTIFILVLLLHGMCVWFYAFLKVFDTLYWVIFAVIWVFNFAIAIFVVKWMRADPLISLTMQRRLRRLTMTSSLAIKVIHVQPSPPPSPTTITTTTTTLLPTTKTGLPLQSPLLPRPSPAIITIPPSPQTTPSVLSTTASTLPTPIPPSADPTTTTVTIHPPPPQPSTIITIPSSPPPSPLPSQQK